MDVVIGMANRTDLFALLQLAQEAMPERMSVYELRRYFELFPDLVFAARRGEALVGFGCAGIDMCQATGWLLFNCVSPAYQGQGIGKRLIEARLSALRQFPFLDRVRVVVNRANRPSLLALASFGFQWSRTELDYYGPGKHREILELRLQPAEVDASIRDGLGAPVRLEPAAAAGPSIQAPQAQS